ncbi:MAG: M20 family metallopeptidase [Candidatus Odinarchaeota archaeon]
MKLSNSLKERLAYLLKQLIKIRTENPPGKTKEIVNFLVNEVFLENEGFQNEIVPYFKNNIELHNLITKIGSGKKKIFLSGHFDVVPSGDRNKWIYPPFSAKTVNGKVYGWGSADMKGGITSLIGVMKVLNTNPEFLDNYELVFLGTADEETGMSGSLTLTERGYIQDAEVLIIAEPTNLNIGIAEKGLLWVILKVYGKSAHGSMPSEGINAIEGILKVIPQLYKCLDVDKENSILGKSTINIGKISGGTKINIVPDYSELEVDFRVIPEQKQETILNKLKSINLGSCSIELEILKSHPPLQTDFNHPFIRNLEIISNSKYIGLSYATDIVNFVDPNNPIPFIIFGPGNPNVTHKLNESVSLEDIFRATEILINALLETYTN